MDRAIGRPALVAATNVGRPGRRISIWRVGAGRGAETVLYVWTRDADGKDSDFLSVVDVDPGSATFGTIVATVPTNSAANEAHHFGYTAGADRIMAAGMFTNKLFLYDVRPIPGGRGGQTRISIAGARPHTMYAVPGGAARRWARPTAQARALPGVNDEGVPACLAGVEARRVAGPLADVVGRDDRMITSAGPTRHVKGRPPTALGQGSGGVGLE
jgi:hypothetical protein